MSNISRLSINEFTKGSIENGFVKTKAEAWNIICQQAGQSFMHKLDQQKVKTENEEVLGAVYISEENDAMAITFRDKWFEVYVNYELLNAGVDHHVFVELTDKKRIDTYKQFDKKFRSKDKRPVAMPYDPEENDELMKLWKIREEKNRKLKN